MRKRNKILLWIVILAAVIALFGATAVRRLRQEEVKTIESVQEAEGMPVDYVVTQAVTVEDWRKFVGVAEGYEQTNLFADYRTRVSAVHVKVGDRVTKGKVIVSLDEYDPARFAVNLGTSRAQYYTAQRDSSRMEELFRSGAISQQELEHVRTETDRARAAYKTARRAVELDSSISGVVTALYVESGEYAEAGEILATVSSYQRIRIALDVSATEVATVEAGQKVRLPLTTGRTDKTSNVDYLYGAVANVSLSADPDSRLFRVDLMVGNPDGILKPGSLVAPQIEVASSGDGPAVPESALMNIAGVDMVYVIAGSGEDRHAELRKVSTGIGDGSLLAVNSGLRPGEWVVVWGQRRLSDGLKVKLHEDLTREFFKGQVGEERSK